MEGEEEREGKRKGGTRELITVMYMHSLHTHQEDIGYKRQDMQYVSRATQ